MPHVLQTPEYWNQVVCNPLILHLYFVHDTAYSHFSLQQTQILKTQFRRFLDYNSNLETIRCTGVVESDKRTWSTMSLSTQYCLLRKL